MISNKTEYHSVPRRTEPKKPYETLRNPKELYGILGNTKEPLGILWNPHEP